MTASMETRFTENAHKATTVRDICDKIEKTCEDVKTDETITIANPASFPMREEIVHRKCQPLNHEDEAYESYIGVSTNFNALRVDLISAVKREKKKKGGTRVIGSPIKANRLQRTISKKNRDDQPLWHSSTSLENLMLLILLRCFDCS